ncbi:hypothetical protein BC940DRAFT_305768 [Gongronella butleri]|nr:hypothetical protein BC940DRAFT_305768 [Gongronella butleri]
MEEAKDIEAHSEYIRKMLRWTIHDLERFINLLKARVQAEEVYVQHLSRVSTRLVPVPEPEQIQYNNATSFQHAVLQYEASISKVAEERMEYINLLRDQIQVLMDLREKQLTKRKNLKTKMSDVSAVYTTYRIRDYPKVKKNYDIKCRELVMVQQEDAPTQDAQHVNSLQVPADDARRSLDGDPDTDESSSISSVPDHRKKVNAFMAQVRTQFAAATANINDVSKQNTRISKIKKEVQDADADYRKGVRTLEQYRKDHNEIMDFAQQYLKVMITDKAEAARSVLSNLANKEMQLWKVENNISRTNLTTCLAIDYNTDVKIFRDDYQRHQFIRPDQLFYHNQLYTCRDVLFGSSLDEYVREHHRTVPLIVTQCITAVEEMGGLDKEGIYRISGRLANTEMLKLEFEKDEAGFKPQQQHFDVFTIASVLKIYLRELETPLFPFNVQERMIYSQGKNPETRQVFLEENIKKLKPVNRDTLEVVIRHLARVNEHAATNKMNVQNLSYMFTPAIFHDHNQADSAQGEWKSDLVFEDLILYHDKVFSNVRTQLKQLEMQRRNYQQAKVQRQWMASPQPSAAPIAQPHPLPPPPPHHPIAADGAQLPSPPPTATQAAAAANAAANASYQPVDLHDGPLSAPPLTTAPAPPAPTSPSPPAPPVLPKHSSPDPSTQESTELQKTHGIIRRATLKARQGILPRQSSLRRRADTASATAAPPSTASEILARSPSTASTASNASGTLVDAQNAPNQPSSVYLAPAAPAPTASPASTATTSSTPSPVSSQAADQASAKESL